MMTILAGLLPALLVAQAPGATVSGTILDGQTRRPLAGAVVNLGDIERHTLTDSLGRYALPEVPAGPQHISVRLIGYADRTLHALVPRTGWLEINISLRPQPIPLARVEVRTRIPVRGIETGRSEPFPDRRLSIAAIRHHPLLTEADVLRALTGGEANTGPEAPRGLHVRGGGADHIAYLLDGIPVFSPYHAAGLFSAWNPDAIAAIELFSSAPSPALPDALSGVVLATTRTPGARFRGQGSVGTTQSRVTLDGPIGSGGAGFLLSLRRGYPAALAPGDDASHLRGETGDWLAKVETPAFGGRIRILGYESENELDAAVNASEAPPTELGRNTFGWTSRSLGAEWSRARENDVQMRVRAWRSVSEARAVWTPEDTEPVGLASDRRDAGIVLEIERDRDARSTIGGLRLERIRTAYRADGSDSLAIRAETPVVSVFAHHVHPVGRRTTIGLAGALMVSSGELYWGPRIRAAWQPLEPLSFSASWARLHQFAQSLRNAESVAGMVFPVDLYAGAAAARVPPGNSNQWVLTADYRPAPGVHVAGQVHVIHSRGLLLSAPGTPLPFAGSEFAVGTSRARGLTLEASASGSRVAILSSWSWQDVRFAYEDAGYVPDHGTRNRVEGGLILFPTATSSIRIGATGAFGRRATAVEGTFEWESCNLLDRGCEFGGSPGADVRALGETRPPAYLRVDVGVRRHWHIEFRGHDAIIEAFASVTNVLGRQNVLTLASDPHTGEQTWIEMRPRAPLAVGLDWRF